MTTNETDDVRFTPVMLRRDLVLAGWTDKSIARMVRGRQWVRVRTGAYVDRQTWLGCDDSARHVIRTRCVVLQAKTDLVVSHTSALAIYDGPLWGLDLTSVHATRRDGKAGRHEAGVRQHCGKVREGDVVSRLGLDVMSATRLALEVCTVAPVEPALVATNHLLHRKDTTLEALRARYELGIDRWADTLHAEIVLRLADPRIESPGESRTHYLVYSHSLPAPELQYDVRDASGKVVATVDFAWPELGVFLEFDGLVKYQRLLREGETASDAVVREKRREEMICELTGWRCIRLIWADLENPGYTVMRLRRMLFPEVARAV